MRKYHALIAAAALATALGACSGSKKNTQYVVATAQAVVSTAEIIGTLVGKQTFVSNVKDQVSSYCGFIPTSGTLSALAESFAPETAVTVALIEQATAGVCAAVQNPQVAYMSGGKSSTERRGSYRNVPIKGRRTTN